MGMRPAARMKVTIDKVGIVTAGVSLGFTIAAFWFAYKAVDQHVLDTRAAFLAIFGLLFVISVNS